MPRLPPLAGPRMHARLAQVDPDHRRPPGPERQPTHPAGPGSVASASASPLSAFHKSKTELLTQAPSAITRFFPLKPENRAWLHERIAQRFDAMLAAGFMDEVQQPCAHAATCTPTCPACAAWATAKRGKSWTSAARKAPRSVDMHQLARAKASPPRASWPSAKSPGCAACPAPHDCLRRRPRRRPPWSPAALWRRAG